MTLRLWTILTEAAWQHLNERGYLVCDDEAKGTEEFLHEYHWMMGEMTARIGPADPEAKLPLWAWYQYDDRRKMPIAREGHLPKRAIGYRVECHLPKEEVLLSDFELWHCVLNYSYLPDSVAYCEDYDDKPEIRIEGGYWGSPADPHTDHLIRASWQRIFDLDWHLPWVAKPREKKSIQACFWRLDMAQVRRVHRFVAR